MSAEKVENEAVSDIFNSILAEFKSKCRDLLSRAAIPDSNEDLLNSQHHTETEAIYLEKKKNNLEAIYTGYAEEERAWEENLSFFSNPASIQCVEMTDCIFENINDTATLSNINDRCANLLSLLHSVKDIKDEATEARNSLVTVYQQEVLRRWNALGKINSILAEFKSKCRDLLSRAAIPDSNEDLLNSQHHTETEAIYLEKKKNNLEAIYTGYAEEERAWEENLSFFSNPASIQCVEMTDCIFENINDTATLSNINDRCANLLSLLHSVKDIKDEATEARNSLVTVYQQEVLRRWNALGKSVNPRDISMAPSRKSIQ
ncbi:hypothetical protein AV274_1825 [Blastocystis sp. ATCC 50177/Nand II]|uniref:Uncharacterized protein n=1 Tax=Blastocystis sp. subtype 1 (strain ATCC 50177 / NandII) TaxID=478820 RepID=A0A196SJT5_BLAHN|nr:hypothetical protein AV274_1825 [Blastocystis sp. ATCC 50177/Nand II]